MFDKFYAEQPKVMFKACGLGFLKEDEGERSGWSGGDRGG